MTIMEFRGVLRGIVTIVLLSSYFSHSPVQAQSSLEDFRPRYHFTPEKNWINDPCGMVYLNGEYHLMYQYNPYGTHWGNMSWGHAVSADMIHWEELPVALFPDELGAIFSGGAVIDKNNTAGFGEDAMVAVYTSAGDEQQQSIAYSLDQGRTWTKFQDNPVLPNPDSYREGTHDFRDPMVFWHEPTSRWIMALAVLDRIEFYSSPNLKEWSYLSSFGQNIGSHGGVWECPDFFLQKDQLGNEYWVLLVSINPGGPQGGSATQYFIGSFDGQTFSLTPSFNELLTKEITLPEGAVFEDFESESYQGWSITGNAFGSGPAAGTLGGQQHVSGYLGQKLVNSFANGDASTGTLTSSEFTIEHNYISFLIGGGNHPGKTGIRLIIDGQEVSTATGQNSEKLSWNTWDVTPWKGKQARLEIIDLNTGGWGHINIDHIYFSNEPVIDDRIEALWADWGTDNYAGRSFENFPEGDNRRVWMGWMNNWSYAGDIPTSSWRGAMTIPRTLELYTTDDIPKLIQHPVDEIETLRNKKVVDLSDVEFPEFKTELSNLSLTSQSYELELIVEIGSGDQFEINFLERLGFSSKLLYDADNELLTFDRRTSGFVNFNGSFPGIYEVSVPPVNGLLKLRIFVDRTSIEIFVNDGLEVLTFSVFPVDESSLISAEVVGNPKVRQASLWQLSVISPTLILALNPKLPNGINITPNPVLPGEPFQLEGVEEDILSIQLYSLNGQLINPDSINVTDRSVTVYGISSGLYLLQAETNTTSYRTKILIK